MRGTPRALIALCLVAAALSLGCRRSAGGSCTPGSVSACPGGWHCSQVEVCTKPCSSVDDCRILCEASCAGGEACVNGVCRSTLSLVCTGGYCQRPCADVAGGCPYDPYGPTDRHAD